MTVKSELRTIVIITIIFLIVGYIGFNYYKEYIIKKKTQEFNECSVDGSRFWHQELQQCVPYGNPEECQTLNKDQRIDSGSLPDEYRNQSTRLLKDLYSNPYVEIIAYCVDSGKPVIQEGSILASDRTTDTCEEAGHYSIRIKNNNVTLCWDYGKNETV